MKKVLLTSIAMILITLSMKGQKLWKNEVDDFTGDVKKFTSFYNVAKTEIGLIKASVCRINDRVFLKIRSTSDIGCSGSSKNYVIFKFTDGTSIRLDKDLSDIDCADDSRSIYIISKDSPLRTKKLSKIRLRMTDYYTDGPVYGTYSLIQLINATN